MEAEAKAGEAEAEAEAGFHNRVVISASMIMRHEHDLNDVNDCRGVIFVCLEAFQVDRLAVGFRWIYLVWYCMQEELMIPAMDSGSFGPGW